MRNGLTLVEVLLAGLILAVVMIPSIGMLTTSSAETVKIRSRVIAVNLAASMVEQMRSRLDGARADVPSTAADQLPQFSAIMTAYRASNAPGQANVDHLIADFTDCSATLGTATPIGQGGLVPPATMPSVTAVVKWHDAGNLNQLATTDWLGSTP